MAISDASKSQSNNAAALHQNAVTKPFQFTLGSLLPLVASIAVLVSIYAYMGVDNGSWHFAFAMWLITSLTFAYGGMKRVGWLVLIIALILLCSLMIGTNPLMIVSLSFVAQFILAVLCFGTRGFFVGFGNTRLDRWYIAVVALAIGFGIWTTFPNRGADWILSKRDQFAIVDLQKQLAFETRSAASPAPTLNAAATAFLEELESLLGNEGRAGNHPSLNLGDNAGRRHDVLRQIHDDHYFRFVRTEGFGAARVVPLWYRVSNEQLSVPPPDQFKSDEREWQDLLPWPKLSRLFDAQQDLSIELFQVRRNQSLRDLHFFDIVDFVNPVGWGWSPEFQMAAGFVPHAFYVPPDTTTHENAAYAIENLQLVTINRFDEPRVFVLDDLPRMDEITGDHVPTRWLNDFERRALAAALQAGEDIAVETHPPQLYMVGAIRATKQCLQCHDAQRGQLLGAFTYRLVALNSGSPIADAK